MAYPTTVPNQVLDNEYRDINYRILNPYATITDKITGRKINIPFTSLTRKYRHILSNIVITLELTLEEQEKYLFKPKMLSEYLYGTTEFWSDLLILNNYYKVADFKPKVVKVYDPDKFKKYLNEILVLEEVE